MTDDQSNSPVPQQGGFRGQLPGKPRLTLASLPNRTQLAYLPMALTKRERTVVRIAMVVALIAFVSLAVRFLGRHIEQMPRAGGDYAEALVGYPQYVNPILAYGNEVDQNLNQLIFAGLFRTDASGALMPSLADHYEVSEDQKTYIVTLRQDALWHDNVPLTASDVAFTFDRIKDPAFQSPYYARFKDVTVDIVGDYAIQFTLAAPYAPFLSTLTVGILPEHLWSDIPAANITLTEYNTKPVGSGPFAFEQLTKDRLGTIKSYRLARFDEYFGEKPYLDSITFRFYPEKTDVLDAVKRRKVDGVGFIPSDQRDEFADRGLNLQNLRLPQYTAVFFNQRNPLLKEKIIRQALERAIDKQALIDGALNGAGEVIHSPILPGFLGYNAAIQGLAFDTTAARKQLDDAGWTWLEGDASRKKNGKELRFTLTTVDRSDYVATAELLRAAWAAIGVTIDVHIFSSDDIIKKVVKPRDYEALLFGEILGTDPDPYPFWHSSQSYDPGLNLAIFYNKDVDKLLEEARQTNDTAVREQKYLQFETIIAEELPALFLYDPYYTYGLPKRMRGFTLDRIFLPSDRFNGVEHWHVRTRLGWQ